MVSYLIHPRPGIFLAISTLLPILGTCANVRAQTNQIYASNIQVVSVEGKVEIFRVASQEWISLSTNSQNITLKAGDEIRTLSSGRAIIRLNDRTIERLGSDSRMRILEDKREKSFIELLKGFFHFSHRDRPGKVQIRTMTVSMGTRGTEFAIEVIDEEGTTLVSLLEGEIGMTNALGHLVLRGGNQAIASPNTAPHHTFSLASPGANDFLQWFLYYPGVLDVAELPLSTEEYLSLANSLSAYRKGDLKSALELYPEGKDIALSQAESLYFSGLLLAAGRLAEAEQLLHAQLNIGDEEGTIQQLAESLRTLILAVKFQTREQSATQDALPHLASTWLAESYYAQSRSTEKETLKSALSFAERAARQSPQFGYAWIRIAELEFSFGRTKEAESALMTGLQLSPRNSQAHALKGFLLASRNRYDEALNAFNHALDLDNGLGNAWLGRGLLRIRQNLIAEGRADLEMAATVEPQRALLRSYLGKAYQQEGQSKLANKAFQRSISMDSSDPTPWLYRALMHQQESRINEAIRDLETSKRLNDNRQLYRSKMLLDQDRAVRSANLASIYRDAGMFERSVLEASLGILDDYANSSAHLHFADSFHFLRDSSRFDLRYETVWFNELLLANILAPVGNTRLSRQVTQHEYSKLFDVSSFGLINQVEYRSDGQVHTQASQTGQFGSTAYALDLDYSYQEGTRPHGELNRVEWYTTVKHQFTPQNSALLLLEYQDSEGDDNFQYYRPTQESQDFNFKETQKPIAVGAFHHLWQPGHHTLFLGGRLQSNLKVQADQTGFLHLREDSSDNLIGVTISELDLDYESELETYTAEINQIHEFGSHTVVAGGRYQNGDFETHAVADNPSIIGLPVYLDPPAGSRATEQFERISIYGYYTIKIIDPLALTAGLVYDKVTYPENFRHPPIDHGHDHESQLSPKASLIWYPTKNMTLRGIYTRSLGGISLDESFRLEPTQLAGFIQSYRTIISESIAGSVAAPSYETLGMAMDIQLGTATYLELKAEKLGTELDRTIGVFYLDNGVPPFFPTSIDENLDYRETSVGLTLNHLIGDNWAVGGSYRFTRSELDENHPGIPQQIWPEGRRRLRSELHKTSIFLLFNHSSGIFSRAESQWYYQENSGYSPSRPGDSFWMHHFNIGYRFRNRKTELAIGIMNLANQNYRLNPLNHYTEWPRERVYTARLKLQF